MLLKWIVALPMDNQAKFKSNGIQVDTARTCPNDQPSSLNSVPAIYFMALRVRYMLVMAIVISTNVPIEKMPQRGPITEGSTIRLRRRNPAECPPFSFSVWYITSWNHPMITIIINTAAMLIIPQAKSCACALHPPQTLVTRCHTFLTLCYILS